MVDFSRISDDYCIDSLGNVYSRPRHKAKGGILRQVPNAYGYPCVRMVIGGKKVNKAVHRILAERFIPNPLRLPQVNHKDGNKRNYALSNLEWCDSFGNNQHAWKTGLQRFSSKTGEPNISRCKQTGKFRVTIKRFGKQIHLGRFAFLSDAILARNSLLSHEA